MTPVVVFSCRLGGSAGETDQEYGVWPPVPLTTSEYDCPCTPTLRESVVIVNGPGPASGGGVDTDDTSLQPYNRSPMAATKKAPQQRAMRVASRFILFLPCGRLVRGETHVTVGPGSGLPLQMKGNVRNASRGQESRGGVINQACCGVIAFFHGSEGLAALRGGVCGALSDPALPACLLLA